MDTETKFQKRSKVIVATVDASSLETSDITQTRLDTLEVDVEFRLDVKKFLSAEGMMTHQLMLVAGHIEPHVHQSQIKIRHLVDIGVLRFSPDDPDLDEDVICRVVNDQDFWTPKESLRQIWNSFVREIRRYIGIELNPPQVPKKRVLSFAILGMKYFKGFISPELVSMGSIYFFPPRENAAGKSLEEDGAPRLFMD